jgi:nucleoid-associated protein YgaU
LSTGRLAAVILFSLSLVYCATTPDPAPGDPLGIRTETGDAGQAAAVAESLRQARVALARAAEAGAETYDPFVLQEARDALQEGERLRSSDPERAGAALARAKLKADESYRNSLGVARQQLKLTMMHLLQELRDNEVDQFTPQEYSGAEAAVAGAEELFDAGRLAAGSDAANAAIRRMQALRDTVTAQLARVLELKRATEMLQEQLGAAAQADQMKVAEMNDLYQKGEEALLDRYALGEAERHFGAAREAGRSVLRADDAEMGAEMTRERVEEQMYAVMRELESASLLTIITDEEIVVEPMPWEGAEVLSGVGTALRPMAGAAFEQVPQHALLQQAKELWRQGVAQRNAGDHRRAAAYFEQAQRYAGAYEALAVMTTYTVRLIPERRESLWRIAEYDFIYGNPWLWPRIWHRNRKLIQDPDLIYPGWQLYIPPAHSSSEAEPAAPRAGK